LAVNLYSQYARGFVEKTMDVLVEQRKSNLWEGHTPNYLMVKFSSASDLQGKIVPVKLTEIRDKFLVGEEIR
jgi:tRNA A37 methylthiotransferase MiaB